MRSMMDDKKLFEELQGFLDKECDMNFFYLLEKLIADSNLDDNVIYNSIDMDRRVFNKFRNDRTCSYKFSKKNILRLCIALQLSEEDSTRLLKSAGYTFSTDKFDQIVRYYIRNAVYNYHEINDMLYRMTESCFE